MLWVQRSGVIFTRCPPVRSHQTGLAGGDVPAYLSPSKRIIKLTLYLDTVNYKGTNATLVWNTGQEGLLDMASNSSVFARNYCAIIASKFL